MFSFQKDLLNSKVTIFTGTMFFFFSFHFTSVDFHLNVMSDLNYLH